MRTVKVEFTEKEIEVVEEALGDAAYKWDEVILQAENEGFKESAIGRKNDIDGALHKIEKVSGSR